MTIAERLAAFPTLEVALADCPNRDEHTPGPPGYFEAYEWAREKAKTHRQRRCPGCGRYLIWVAK